MGDKKKPSGKTKAATVAGAIGMTLACPGGNLADEQLANNNEAKANADEQLATVTLTYPELIGLREVRVSDRAFGAALAVRQIAADGNTVIEVDLPVEKTAQIQLDFDCGTMVEVSRLRIPNVQNAEFSVDQFGDELVTLRDHAE